MTNLWWTTFWGGFFGALSAGLWIAAGICFWILRAKQTKGTK